MLKVGAVKTGVCNYLYGRDVKATGKFCAGGVVDACQVIVFIFFSLGSMVFSCSLLMLQIFSPGVGLVSGSYISFAGGLWGSSHVPQ